MHLDDKDRVNGGKNPGHALKGHELCALDVDLAEHRASEVLGKLVIYLATLDD
jgi:hypothetical protein